MARQIKARFSKGKLEPLESLELEEGEDILSFQGAPWPSWKSRIEDAAKKAGVTSEKQVVEIIREERA